MNTPSHTPSHTARFRIFRNGNHHETGTVYDGEGVKWSLEQLDTIDTDIVYIHDTYWLRQDGDWVRLDADDDMIQGLYGKAVRAERRAAGMGAV